GLDEGLATQHQDTLGQGDDDLAILKVDLHHPQISLVPIMSLNATPFGYRQTIALPAAACADPPPAGPAFPRPPMDPDNSACRRDTPSATATRTTHCHRNRSHA